VFGGRDETGLAALPAGIAPETRELGLKSRGHVQISKNDKFSRRYANRRQDYSELFWRPKVPRLREHNSKRKRALRDAGRVVICELDLQYPIRTARSFLDAVLAKRRQREFRKLRVLSILPVFSPYF
jgi:hypothetical protein